MDDDERPEPDCPQCFGTGDVPGWDADNETLIWYPCGCLTETEGGDPDH